MKNKSYEESLARLEEIIARLESPEITLEESMKFFEEGIVLVKQCGDVLNKAGQKVEELSASLGQIQNEWE